MLAIVDVEPTQSPRRLRLSRGHPTSTPSTSDCCSASVPSRARWRPSRSRRSTSWIDLILGVVFENVNAGVTAAPVYYDYQAVIEWHPNAHNPAAAGGVRRRRQLGQIRVHQRQVASIARRSPVAFNSRSSFIIVQLSWISDLAPGTRSTAMVSFGYFGQGINVGPMLSANIQNFPFNARYELGHTLSRFLRLDMGYDIIAGPSSEYINVQSRGNTFALQSSSQQIQIHPATYIEAEITPVPHLRLVPGVRADWFSDIQHRDHSAAVFLHRWELGYGFALRGGVGLYAEPPTAQQNAQLQQNSAIPGEMLGTPNLLPQRAMHYAVGFEEHLPALRGASWTSNLSLSGRRFLQDPQLTGRIDADVSPDEQPAGTAVSQRRYGSSDPGMEVLCFGTILTAISLVGWRTRCRDRLAPTLRASKSTCTRTTRRTF